MSPIFNYIHPSSILVVDNYNDDKIKIHTFANVVFRTQVSSYLSFYTPVGIINKKIISITNRQLSFLLHKYIHFIGDEYSIELKNTYMNAFINPDEHIIINEDVFQFFDYDSVSGTGHSYDLMFYLIYHYTINKVSAKLLVVNSNNKYYNSTLNLIKTYFNVEYIYINPSQTYTFKSFTCVRTYQNVFFHEVKQFINSNLLLPIIQKYEANKQKYYDIIIKLKYNAVWANDRLHTSHEKTTTLIEFCKINSIYDLNDEDNEELKIFLINKAKKIIINWGSIYIININYYLYSPTSTFITIIFHKNIMPEIDQLTRLNDTKIKQNMPPCVCANITNQVYNTFCFNGEIIPNITNIDDYIASQPKYLHLG